jgi:peptide/nickel transport system substrate-binding protein
MHRRVFTRRGFIGSAAALGGSLLTGPASTSAAPARYRQDTPKTGGVLKVGAADPPSRWDLHASGSGRLFDFTAPVFNTLIAADPADPTGQTLVPDLATDWEVSEDGLTYTFPLRTDVLWHDGEPFTSADTLISMNKIITPPEGMGSVRQALFDSVDKVEAPDEHTIIFHLKFPDAAFLEILSIAWNVIYPKHILDEFGLDAYDSADIEHKIGTGPFKFTDFALNQYVTMERNPDYFKPGWPYLDGIEYRYFPPDDTARMTALLTGQIDIFGSYPGTLQGELALVADQQPNVTVSRQPILSPVVFYVNVTQPPFDDINVRQAISEALDRDALTAAYVDGGVAGALVFPGSPWEMEPSELEQMPGYGKDMAARQARAKDLLAQSGYDESNPLAIDLLVVQAPDSESVGVVAAPMLEAVGIQVNFTRASDERQSELRASGDFGATVNFLSQTGLDPTHLFGTYLHCDVPRNQSRICVPELDELWTEQRQAPSFEERKPLVDEMHKGYLEQASFDVVTWRNGLGAWANYVKDFAQAPGVYTSHLRMEGVWLDK